MCSKFGLSSALGNTLMVRMVVYVSEDILIKTKNENGTE